MAEKRTNPAVARSVEKQMRNWEISRAQQPGRPPGESVHDFVTIANNVGAGGNDVAVLLAQRLGWSLYDRQLLTGMAQDDKARERLYRSMDERDLGWMESAFRSFMQGGLRKNDYFHRLIETVLLAARQAPAVFVGRSADLILPRERGLRVKVVASPGFCAESFAKRNDVPVAQARQEIARIEQERQDFIRHHFHIDPVDATRFDLLINLERFTAPSAVELVLAAMGQRRKQ